MQSRLIRPCLLTLIIAALVCGNLFSDRVSAQEGGAGLWYKTANVTYKKKPDRKPSPRPRIRVEKKTLLTLQWRLFERGEDNVREEVDPNKVFASNDQVKLAVTANQPGYLYIINQTEGKDGILLFPDPTANGGDNYVEKDKEYYIPDKCSDKPDVDDCWMGLNPEPKIVNPTENLIVIFSRDEITTLPRRVKTAGDVIKRYDIAKIVANSSKQVKQVKGSYAIPNQSASRYATWVQNTDTRDNEDLVTVIKIKHRDMSVSKKGVLK
jgi:hypothetical protein